MVRPLTNVVLEQSESAYLRTNDNYVSRVGHVVERASEIIYTRGFLELLHCRKNPSFEGVIPSSHDMDLNGSS